MFYGGFQSTEVNSASNVFQNEEFLLYITYFKGSLNIIYLVRFFCLFGFCFFETMFLCVTAYFIDQAVSNSQKSTCLGLSSAGIKGGGTTMPGPLIIY